MDGWDLIVELCGKGSNVMTCTLLTDAKPITMESGFSLTLNFSTLYLSKTESLHF
jgi:hypothetical protein